MEDFITRVVGNMIERTTGPMHLRLLFQPFMAIVFAVVSGLRDARLGKPPYGWTLFTDAQHRADMVKDGWKSVGKVFLAALLLDAVYQTKVEGFIYPGELVTVALVLAIIPYLLVRGVVTRFARFFLPARGGPVGKPGD